MNSILSAIASWSNGARQQQMDPNNRVDDGGSSWSDLWWRQETVQEDDDVLSDDEPHGSPFRARERKRRRHCSPSNDAAVDDTTKQITLPPEVWADVMRFLPFDMILTCGAVSRSMLNETMPLITKLQIDKSAQMNLAVASRFRDVTDIHINCLLYTTVDEEFTDVEVREESKIRTVPFLSRFARTLERVYFGAKTEAGEDIKGFAPAAGSFWQGEDSYPDEGARESLMIFIDMLSGAFICGALPAHLKISGLCCPDTQERRSVRAQCAICQRACKSFPLESVIEFECLGSSIASARYGRPYGLDVCLEKAEIESIIESRPGGKELLRSDKRLLTLLGSGWRYEIKSDDGDGALVIVKYKKSQLDEMKRVIQYAELDVKKLSMAKLQEAVSKSFIKGSSSPSKSQCYLSEESLASLRGKLGVCIDTEMVGGSVSDLLRYVKPICKVLAQYYDEEAPHNELVFEEAQFEYEAVIYHCFKLIRRVLELQKDAPIQDIVDAKGIPCLISGLRSLELFEVNLEAATSLKLILTNGKEEHRKIIIHAGVIAKFCCLLKPFHLTPDNANVSKMAVLSLVNILSNEKKEHMDAIVQAEGIRKLIGLLASHDDVLVDSALHLLSIAANDRVQKLLRDGGLDFLFGIILSPEDHLDHLQKCATLLCKVFDFDDGFEPIQRAIDAKLISKLVETLRTSENEIVKTNLALVCFKVASVKNEYLLHRLLGVTNFLSTLVGLQDSSIESVSDKAITCLEQIVSIESCFGIESEEPLAWGEYRVLELVDSDEESSVSCEEALEVSDEQVELEEKQAKDANVQRELTGSWVEDDDVDETESPSLLGLPVHLLGAILIYATETEIEVKRLATVCKRVNEIVKYADGGYLWGKFWTLHPTFEWQQRRASLREIRKLQKSTQNEIMAAICGDINVDGQQAMIDADELRTFTTNLLSRLNCLGPVASFRLRGDTIGHLFELCQCYMIERLEQASFLAINSYRYRTEVQRHDFNVLPSQEMRQGAMWEDRAPGFPSSSGITWIWPDDDCCDVLPKGTVRRIIRRLASKAGIVRMSSSAFDHAEAELLRTIAVLLVEAYESSVQMSKSARFLHNTETLPYGMFPNSMDMFYVPPPPFYGPNDEELYACKSDNFMSEQLVYTIVPGQISAAAARRNIRPGPTSINAFAPIRVYGEWIASSGNSPSEEMKIEKGNYYEVCDSDSSSYYGSDEDDSSDDSA